MHTLLSSGFTSENIVVGENMLCQAGKSCYWRGKPERSQRLEDRPCSATGEAGGGGDSRFKTVMQVYSCPAVSYTVNSSCIYRLFVLKHTSSLKSQQAILVGTLVNPCRVSFAPDSRTALNSSRLNADSSVYIFYIE